MKQLYKASSSFNSSPSSIPYSSKPQKALRPRSSIAQRLLFLLLGALIASTLFLVHPYLITPSSTPNPFTSSSHLDSIPLPLPLPVHHHNQHQLLPKGPKRVPVGLKNPSKRIVVTGGAGFVGSHLVDRLLDRGDTVIVIDNFFTGRKDNLVHRFGDPRFELIRHDVVEPILLEADQIYHLACPASPVHYKYNPIKTIISFFLITNCVCVDFRFLRSLLLFMDKF